MTSKTISFDISDTFSSYGALKSVDTEEAKKAYTAWEANKFPEWPAPVKFSKAFERTMNLLPNKKSLDAKIQTAMDVVIRVAEENGIPVVAGVPPPPPSAPPAAVATALVVPPAGTTLTQYTLKDGKLVREFDVVSFQKSVLSVRDKLKKEELRQAAMAAVADIDFFALIVEILRLEEAVWLVAVLGLRLLVPPTVRAEIDKVLVEVKVLCNRSGVLSVGLLRMGGYIALGCCKDEVVLSKVLGRTPNPLLGQELTPRPATKKKDETDLEFTARANTVAVAFANYKAIYDGTKVYSDKFKSMDPAIKAKIRAELLSYFEM